MVEPDDSSRRGRIARMWAFVSRPSARLSVAVLFITGTVFGILFWAGFHWALEVSNTEAFCISCHEMRENAYKELQQTIHYKNRSGVRATCPDCHVPRELIYKIPRKIQASNELFHKIMGTVNTPEKFESHRLAMAKSVWASMKSTDSRECRNCHSAESMDPAKQLSPGAQAMRDGIKAGLTCIDCHMGIAHKLPKVEDEEEEKKD
jgi:cytochrome c-type protein NapC